MITAGVDVGFENTKIVILDDGKIIAKSSSLSGGSGRARTAEKLWAETLQSAGLSKTDIAKVVATGQGKGDVFFADQNVTDAVADSRAARFVHPAATSVFDVGTDQARLVNLKDGDGIQEVVMNQKCMACLGLLLENTADRLEMTLDEIGALPVGVSAGKIVNDGCPVFAELDMLELLNDGVSKEQIAGAVVDMIAVRLNSILNDKIRPSKSTTVMIGGMTKSAAVVQALKARSEIDFIIPEAAEYGAAMGAAMIAGDQPILRTSEFPDQIRE
jgi:benzoyl-CoA reductase subunit D